MSAGSSSHSQLGQALERGDLRVVRRVARECGRIELEDALRIVLLIGREEPELFEPAAVRWLGQLLAARPRLGFAGAGEMVEEMEALLGPDRAVARSRLALVLRGAGEPRVAQVLERG